MVITQERGETFVQHAIDVALGGDRGWKAKREAVARRDERIKAAVVAGSTVDTSWAGTLVTAAPGGGEFLLLVAAQEVIGRLNLRRVPFATPVAAQLGAGAFGWVGQGEPKPVSASQHGLTTLPPRTASGIVVISQELARNTMPAARGSIRDAMVVGVSGFTDQQFLDPAVAEVADVSPASVTNGAASFASTGDPGDDLRQLLGSMLADLKTLLGVALVMGDDVALAMATLLNPAGGARFPNLGVNGGSIYGVPVVTSSAAADLIVGIHQPSVIYSVGDVGVEESAEATLQMESSPSAGPTNLVSLWQTNTLGIRVDRVINWSKTRPDAVRYVANVDYGLGS